MDVYMYHDDWAVFWGFNTRVVRSIGVIQFWCSLFTCVISVYIYIRNGLSTLAVRSIVVIHFSFLPFTCVITVLIYNAYWAAYIYNAYGAIAKITNRSNKTLHSWEALYFIQNYVFGQCVYMHIYSWAKLCFTAYWDVTSGLSWLFSWAEFCFTDL